MAFTYKDTTTTTTKPEVSLGMAVCLNAVRNSPVPLLPGYEKLMGELRKEFDAIDRIQSNKGATNGTKYLPSPMLGRDRIPPVTRQLRALIDRQQKMRIDAAVASWSKKRDQASAAV